MSSKPETLGKDFEKQKFSFPFAFWYLDLIRVQGFEKEDFRENWLGEVKGHKKQYRNMGLCTEGQVVFETPKS